MLSQVLKTFKKVVEFMSVAKDGEVASKLIFFPDPNEVTSLLPLPCSSSLICYNPPLPALLPARRSIT